MSFLDGELPWGSPVVAGIPLPPFHDEVGHRRYLRMLQLHLALLDSGAPMLSTIALLAALDSTGPATDADTVRWLSRLEVSVSLTSWFPAPWTPASLALTLARTYQEPPQRRDGAWHWLGDPDFTAEPEPGGGWTVIRQERGARESVHLSGDRDLVILWMDHFRRKFSFPLAYVIDPADIATLAPASLAIRESDAKDAAFPYRTSWCAERDAALEQHFQVARS